MDHVSLVSIKNQSVLRHLNKEEIAYLEKSAEIRSYQKGDIIFSQGRHLTGCFLVLSGIVKQYKTGAEGRDYILRLAKEFEILGFRSVMSDEPACNTSTVIADSVLCYIPKECLYHLVKTNGSFALDFLQLTCRELELSNLLMADIAHKSVKALLAEFLLTLKNKFGLNEDGFLNIALSREDFANIIGTTTETVIRLLSEFKAERYIDLSGKKIAITNDKALEKLATKVK